MRSLIAALALGLSLTACTATTAGHGSATAARWKPVFFGVPGSGQGASNPPPDAANLPPGVTTDDALRYGTSVARVKNALRTAAGAGLASVAAIRYPAVPVERYITATGLTGALEVSEKKGMAALDTAIRSSYRNGCTDRPVLVAGYSQGAEVVVRAVTELTSEQRARTTVVLLGNPSYRPGTVGDFPGNTAAAGVRPTFLNGEAFTLPGAVRQRTLDVCVPGDPVCGVDPAADTVVSRVLYVLSHARIHEQAYAEDTGGYATRAGRFLWQHRGR